MITDDAAGKGLQTVSLADDEAIALLREHHAQWQASAAGPERAVGGTTDSPIKQEEGGSISRQ